MRSEILGFCVLCLGLGAMVSDTLSADTIYRWVDEAGVVHFSNRPPTGVAAVIVDVKALRPATASGDAGAPAAETGESEGEPDVSYAEQRRRDRQALRQEYTEQQRKLEAECEIMRRQRDWVEPSPRVLVDGEDGNPRRLSDEEREELLTEARTFIAENCD